MVLHFFQKLVHSARLYMKMASWRYCVLKLDSSVEPAVVLERCFLVFRAVPEQSSKLGTPLLKRRFLAPRQVLPWKFRHIGGIRLLVLANTGQVSIGCFFTGPVDAVPAFAGPVDVSTEAEMRSGRRR